MSTALVIAAASAVLLGLGWAVRTQAAVEEPAFTVVASDGAFELRQYAPMLAAETLVTGVDFEAAGDIAFGRLFRYITGNNRGGADIAMTAPVVQQRGEKIAMTAPVQQVADGEGFRVAFIVPASYTADTVPQPLDPAVQIRSTPARLVAVLRYSGSWSEGNYADHEAELRRQLEARGLAADGEPIIARYNAPFMPWPLRRNEVLIPVRRELDK
jgi:hypothetical protein